MGAYGAHHHEELKVLVREHCVILSAARGVLDRALVAGAQDEPAVLKEVDEVLGHLCDHERRENALAEKLMASRWGRQKKSHLRVAFCLGSPR